MRVVSCQPAGARAGRCTPNWPGAMGAVIEPVTLRDGTLVLRPLEWEDRAAISEAAREGGERHAFAFTHPADVAYVKEALDDRAAGRAFPFVVGLDGTVVGSTRYGHIRLADRALEIGWTWYVPRVRRTWVNAAVKRLLLRHAFEALGLVRVELRCDARNVASRRAIAALGAVQEGILRQHMRLPDGFQRDTVVFSVLVAEWLMVRELLTQRIREKRELGPFGER